MGLNPHPLTVAGPDSRARAFAVLAQRAAVDPAISGRSDKALRREAASLMSDLVDAVCGQARTGPLHERLARTWRVEGAKAEAIRRALVLCADHELNASTFAARVTASTGASLAAGALAGLSALSGPLHGGMTAQVTAFIAEARRASDAKGASDAAAGSRLVGAGLRPPALSGRRPPRGRHRRLGPLVGRDAGHRHGLRTGDGRPAQSRFFPGGHGADTWPCRHDAPFIIFALAGPRAGSPTCWSRRRRAPA